MWLKFKKEYSDYNKKNKLYGDNIGKTILGLSKQPRQEMKVLWAKKMNLKNNESYIYKW